MHNLVFDGQSLNELGFAFKDKPLYKTASRNMTFEKVNGSDGDIIVDNENYNNVDIEYNVNTLSYLLPDTEPQIIEQKFVDSFLNADGTYKVLRDTYHEGYFTHAICVTPPDLKPIGNRHFETTLKFNRKPFWYSDSGQEKVFIKTSGTFYLNNPEKYISKPYFKVIGSGSFSLTVNGVTMSISKYTDYIEIDCAKYNVHKNGVSKNNVVTGDYFPYFKPGKNEITITPDSKVDFIRLEIIPNWRRL